MARLFEAFAEFHVNVEPGAMHRGASRWPKAVPGRTPGAQLVPLVDEPLLPKSPSLGNRAWGFIQGGQQALTALMCQSRLLREDMRWR